MLTNPAQQILPRMLSETLDLLSQASFYSQTIRARAPRRDRASTTRRSADDEAIVEVSVIVNQTTVRLPSAPESGADPTGG